MSLECKKKEKTRKKKMKKIRISPLQINHSYGAKASISLIRSSNVISYISFDVIAMKIMNNESGIVEERNSLRTICTKKKV